MLEYIIIGILFFYTLNISVILRGVYKKYKKIPYEKLPTVTVIVAARNEEKNILRCLQSLDKLEYPEGKLEIIISNNNSVDNTGKIIDDFIQDKTRFIHLIPTEDDTHLKGKANALAKAINISKGEIIVTTDADCAVPPTWVETIASYYQDDVGMVMGYTTQETYDHFSGMQMMDFIYLLTIAAGTMNLDYALSAIGNNMSYRKTLYKQVGGYESIPFSVTEDFKLLQCIGDLNQYKIIYPLDQKALVVSEPCEDAITLYRQKKRWAVGGLESGVLGFLVLTISFISNLIMIVSPFIDLISGLLAIAFKMLIDIIVFTSILKSLKLLDKLKYFLTFQFYFITYVISLPFTLIKSRRVIWKDKVYEAS